MPAADSFDIRLIERAFDAGGRPATAEGRAIARIRQAVFTREQGIDAGADLDGQDGGALHALARLDGRPVGTGRLLADGHLGRIAVLAEYRGRGIGRALLERLIRAGRERGLEHLYLGAQQQAVTFYASLGFVIRGTPYLEVGIPHVRMELQL